MNNIQDYGSVNVNTIYGKVNKSPNFKAFIKVNGGEERLENIGKNIVDLATRKLADNMSPLVSFELLADDYIKELKDALKLKKVADNTKYFDGIYNLFGDGVLGIKYKNTENIYAEPFQLLEKNGKQIIQGSLVPKGDMPGGCKAESIMVLTKEEAEKLPQNPSIADVLQACENSIKQKIKQIQDLARDLM